MARFENEFSRSNQMTWGEPQGNGHRMRPATYGRYAGPGEYGGWGSGEGQGEYGGQGYSAVGEFSGRGPGWQDYEAEGYGRPEYGRQSMGWQQGPPMRYAAGRGPGWQQRSFAGPDIGEEEQFEGWRGSGYSGYGPSGRAMSEGNPQGPAAYGRGWRPEMGRGPAGQEWGGRGAAGRYWRQGPGDWDFAPGEQRGWEQRQIGGWGETPFGPQGYGGQGREMAGPMAMFRESFGPGPYTGRGPRGYQRSDARIEEDVNERLTRHGMIDASDISVRVQGGEVTLTGTVDDRYAKRTAEDIAEMISGVKDVNNQLRVQPQEEMAGRMEAQGTTTATRGQSQSQSRGQAPRGETAKATASRAPAA